MSTTVDTVPLLTTAPNRIQGDSGYSAIADSWAASLDTFNVGMNTSIDQLNLAVAEVNADAISAAASAQIAASAMAAVPWVTGETISENDARISQINYLAYRAVEDITSGANTVDPSADASWTPMVQIVGDPAPQLIADLNMNGNAFKETAYNQIADASPATATTHDLDYEDGDLQEVTCPASGTLTIDVVNFPAGKWAAIQVILINAGNCTMSFGASTEFANSLLPTFTVAGKDILQIEEDKDGVRTVFVRGLALGTI